MEWMKTYHEDHKSVLIMLAKLEGSIMDMKNGYTNPNTLLEFKEFGEILDNVIIPHFKQEEKTIYPEVAAIDEETRQFINGMYDEHRRLYSAFDKYHEALRAEDNRGLIDAGLSIIDLLKQHINKEEDDIAALVRRKRNEK